MYKIIIGGKELPENPEKISISTDMDNKTYDVVGLGEIVIPGERKLAKIKFSASFPHGAPTSPGEYAIFFQRICMGKKPVDFLIARESPDGAIRFEQSMSVVVESFGTEDNGEHGLDLDYDLTLLEYRAYQVKVLAQGGATRPRNEPDSGQITSGCEVIANGRVHLDSYGRAPGITLRDYRGKVNFINLKGSHPYHVTTPQGDWLGWMLSEGVQRA